MINARDLHTIAPRPLERTCWRQFAAQCQIWNCAFNAVIVIISRVMQHGRFDLLQHHVVEGIFPLELAVQTPLPTVLSDESVNQGLVCACIHSIVQTQEIGFLDM